MSVVSMSVVSCRSNGHGRIAGQPLADILVLLGGGELLRQGFD